MKEMVNFDERIDRSGMNAVKWSKDVLEANFGERDMIPLWVADMDFHVDSHIQKAVQEMSEHGIYGYSGSNKHNMAFKRWVKDRFDYNIHLNWILNMPGVVPAINLAVQTFTKPGDAVLIQEPVYYPFRMAIENNGRQVVSNDLVRQESEYVIDFDDFERKVKDDKTKLFILCSPHNPVSRVWREDELRKMMDLCIKHNVLVLADEIHNDLVFKPNQHHILPRLEKSYEDNVVLFMAPSKTFNLAGLQMSHVVIPNEQLRLQFQEMQSRIAIGQPNPFAIVGTIAAYEHGEAWLEALLSYLKGNLEFVHDYVQKHMPKVKLINHQATYLLWMDFTELGISDKALQDYIYHEAKVALDGGSWFGKSGEGYMRMNLASPRAMIKEAMDNIYNTLHNNHLI